MKTKYILIFLVINHTITGIIPRPCFKLQSHPCFSWVFSNLTSSSCFNKAASRQDVVFVSIPSPTILHTGFSDPPQSLIQAGEILGSLFHPSNPSIRYHHQISGMNGKYVAVLAKLIICLTFKSIFFQYLFNIDLEEDTIPDSTEATLFRSQFRDHLFLFKQVSLTDDGGWESLIFICK